VRKKSKSRPIQHPQKENQSPIPLSPHTPKKDILTTRKSGHTNEKKVIVPLLGFLRT
jgi:hypothetical protein